MPRRYGCSDHASVGVCLKPLPVACFLNVWHDSAVTLQET